MFTATQPIRDIVAEFDPAAGILARFEIDSVLHGEQNLEQACSEVQLSVEQVLEKLEDAAAKAPNPAELTLTRLIQHIVRVHHRYLREQLPHLVALAQAAASSPSERSMAWSQVAVLLERVRAILVAHFEKEEQILFPYIAQMDDDPGMAYLQPNSGFTSMAETMFFMAQEHEALEDSLRAVEAALPELPKSPAARNFVAAFHALKSDLDTHVHIEDYCLFPRAIAVEQAAKPGR